MNIIPYGGYICTKVGTHVCWSAPQECSTAYWGRGMDQGVYGLRDVTGQGHMIEQDWIVALGVTGMIGYCLCNRSHDCNSHYNCTF